MFMLDYVWKNKEQSSSGVLNLGVFPPLISHVSKFKVAASRLKTNK